MKAVLKQYRIKDSGLQRKFLQIFLSEPVTQNNISLYTKKLAAITEKKTDVILIDIPDKHLLSAWMLKMLLSLYKTYPGKIGIVIGAGDEGIAEKLNLNNYFKTGKNLSTVLVKLEKNGKQQVH